MRILFVAMSNCVHTARWIRQLSGEGMDIHVFPVEDSSIHPELRGVTVHGYLSRKPEHDASVRLSGLWWPLWRGQYMAKSIAERVAGPWAARRLARTIRKLRPDIVHSLEFQHGAYLTLAAREQMRGEFPTWVVSSWGSDIYLFGRLREHEEKVRKILATCDYCFCECQRDLKLAHGMGFKGSDLPVLPNGGGFDLAATGAMRSAGHSAERRVILLKGYQSWSGRALVALRAMEMCAEKLKGYRVVVYSAHGEENVEIAAELLSRSTGITVEVIPPCSHEEMLRWFGRARVYVGLGISDGISTSLLEAMVMGTFPIQSNTSAADEWVRDGETGFIVPPEDPRPVAEALRRAVSEDALVDRAAELNWKTARERLDGGRIRAQVIDMYRKIADRSTGRGQ